MTPRHGVVADDLTGAADSGVQFAAAGLRTRLLLAELTGIASADVDVLLVSTDSRACPPAEAARRVGAAVTAYRRAGITRVFKKIDSTCRGPVGAELSAALEALDPDTLAIVCPAFPGAGRTVVGGHLLVGGQPVNRTSVADDPVTPVTDGRVPPLFVGLEPRMVGIHTVAAGPDATAPALAAIHEAGGRVVVCDAVSDVDLATLVTAADRLDVSVLYTGAAGLAQPVATAWAAATAEVGAATGTTLVVAGSTNPTTRAQVDRLVSALEWRLLRPASAIVAGPADAWARFLDDALMQVREPVDGLVLAAPSAPPDVEEARAVGRDDGLLDDAEVADRIACRLAELAAGLSGRLTVTGLVATGGDVARATLAALSVKGVDLIGEVEAGIPLGRCSIAGTTCWVVTKAGGFGDDATLVRAVQHVRARARSR